VIRKAFTVYYDSDSGEAIRLEMVDVFESESPLMRADVLKDAVFMVSGAYAESRSAAFDLGRKRRNKKVMHHPV